MKRILLFAFLLALILVIVLKDHPYSLARMILARKIIVGGKKVSLVEIAKTDKEREKGLSGRKSLCADCGLLFVFDAPGIYPFWMKGMNFDIDIIWIAGERVVDITEGVKKPAAVDLDKPKDLYMSKVEIDKVLEVNAGWVKKNKIFVGDGIEY